MTSPVTLPGMDGRHPSMLKLYDLVHRAASANVSALIVGETGTGKELVARALHELSHARDGEFVDINCAAFPEGTFEGELFGWEKGAFTGSVGSRAGLVEAADGGTLFLDEICSMPLHLQAKLLRVIEERKYRPLGASTKRRSNFRVVAAASMSPGRMLSEGKIRADLLYRLAVVKLEIPPLRERGADVDRLARHFATDCCGGVQLCECLLDGMRDHPWPGNVRELKAAIQRLALTSDGDPVCREAWTDGPSAQSVPGRADVETLECILEQHGWDIKAAAKTLGISRTTLYKRIRKLRIKRPGIEAESVFN